MRELIKRIAKRCGYSIGRLQKKMYTEDAFEAMQYLLGGIEEPIIFDVGAHHGQVVLKFRELFPSSRIYAFEPFRPSFTELKAKTEHDSNIFIYDFGLCDSEGFKSFSSNSNTATNSLLSSDNSGAQTWGPGLLETKEIIQAKFSTIDSVVAALRISRIDILKLDVQGAEHLVFAGAKNTFKRGIISLIYSEIITQPTYKGQKRFDDALTQIYNNGFDLYNIYNMSRTSEGRLRQIDTIFTKVTP